MRRRFSERYHINAALAAMLDSSSTASDILDRLDEVEERACAECTSRPDCLYRSCERCRFKQTLEHLVNEVLDKDEEAHA